MPRKFLTLCSLAVFTLLTTLSATVHAQWTAQITPYVWAPSVSGSLTPFTNAPNLSFNRSFSEGRKDVDGAFFMSGFARKNRLLFLADISSSSSSRRGTVGPGVPAKGKLKQRSMTLAAGWRVHTAPSWNFDVLAGARLWNIRAEVSAAHLLTARNKKNFTDPILAVRSNIRLSPRWTAIAYLDVGGFGLGSRHTIQALITANYQINDNLFLSAGYRRLEVDYRGRSTQVDWTMQGPILGLTWRF